jgi:uncharacterized caspase-like protein
MVVRVRESLAQGAQGADFDGMLQLLKQATQICMGEGDAWYYRALLERRLNHAQAADLALSKARLFGSEALSNGIDPFAPASRPAPDAGAAPAAAPSGIVRNKWALVVGIGAFRDSRIPALRFTAKDAADVASALTGPAGRFRPENVRLIKDSEATTVNIKAGLNWLARSAGPDDLAVVYLSSHGSPREMDTAGISYAVTYDTDISSPDTLYATSLPMVEIADAVRVRLRAQRAVVFLDTCYSGAAVPGAKDLRIEAAGLGIAPDMLARFRQGTGRVIVTSSSAREKSWEGEQYGNGIFTHFLLEGLKRNEGLSSIDEVFGYVRDRVVETVKKDKGASQVPTMSKSDQGGSIVVGAPAAGA